MGVKKPKDLNRIVNKHQRRSKGQSRMDNPEKLASLDTETKKTKTNTKQHVLDATMMNQAQKHNKT